MIQWSDTEIDFSQTRCVRYEWEDPANRPRRHAAAWCERCGSIKEPLRRTEDNTFICARGHGR